MTEIKTRGSVTISAFQLRRKGAQTWALHFLNMRLVTWRRLIRGSANLRKVKVVSQNAFNCLTFTVQCRYATRRRSTLDIQSAVVSTLLHRGSRYKY